MNVHEIMILSNEEKDKLNEMLVKHVTGKTKPEEILEHINYLITEAFYLGRKKK